MALPHDLTHGWWRYNTKLCLTMQSELCNELRCNIKHITCDFLPRVLLYMKRNNLLAKIYKLENSVPYVSLQGGHTRFSHSDNNNCLSGFQVIVT